MPKRHILGLHILVPFRNKNRKGTAYLNKAGGGGTERKEQYLSQENNAFPEVPSSLPPAHVT